MSDVDISLLLVHMDSSRIARQTLRNLRRTPPECSMEIIVIDNNARAGFGAMLAQEFPEIRYIPMDKNRGFGTAMNVGIREARGEQIFIFNPDLVPLQGAIDTLLQKKRSDASIGLLAPQLLNPDGSLQYSAFAQPTLIIPALRRTPLGKTPWGKRILAKFQLRERDMTKEQEVDWVMGSAMLISREDAHVLSGFDERFFMYLEDADLCRRVARMGKRVVYFPAARMIHYHRRASADGSLLQQLLNPLTWQHIKSACLYALKYRHEKNPPHPSSP